MKILTNYSTDQVIGSKYTVTKVFSSHLHITRTEPRDRGMYVCFVTDKGQLSYKSVSLRVKDTVVTMVKPLFNDIPSKTKLISWLVTSSIVAGIGVVSTLIMMVALCMVCCSAGETDITLEETSKTGKGETPDLLREPSTLTVNSVYPSSSSMPSWTSNLNSFQERHCGERIFLFVVHETIVVKTL